MSFLLLLLLSLLLIIACSPEALGIASGTIFLICLIFCLVGYDATSHPTTKLLDVNSALLSICFMLFLGFTDDVLDWPWRYKLVLPSIASLPLLCCYTGSTSIVVPIPLRSILMNGNNNEYTTFGNLLDKYTMIDIDYNANGKIIDLGIIYLVYMGLLAVFCTNAINIYAGINGLETGQSYVIGCFVLLHNLIEISTNNNNNEPNLLVENHLFSSMLIMNFISVTLGLLQHNWYPATVFVGDTYCYFAGMTFAVVGILGHFSKTLLLFFIPQIFNFIWSVPQLFKFVPCPRHRLPASSVVVKNSKTTNKENIMIPSTFDCQPTQYVWLKRIMFLPKNATSIPNMTLINLFLHIVTGKLLRMQVTEKQLCTCLLMIQILSCFLGLFIRYYIAKFIFDG